MNENIDKGISSLQKRVYWTVPMMLSYHCFRIKYDFQTDCTKWLMVHIFVFEYIISDLEKIDKKYVSTFKFYENHYRSIIIPENWKSHDHDLIFIVAVPCANQNSFKLRLRLICVTRVSIVNSFLTLNHSVYKSNHVKALKICTKFFASTSY